MKLKVAVAGYGNLGKSLEKLALKDEQLELTAIFSRRNLDNELYLPMKDAPDFDNAEVVLLALGSHNDLENNLHYFSKFDTVDSFDTHAKLKRYKQLLNAEKPDTVSLCAIGWDPGILSVVRGLCNVAGETTTTFWGKGISQGHSNALRNVLGVLDAVEITEPKESAKKKILDGETVSDFERHKRKCFVACVQSDKQRIEREIREMPNYFLGQDVEIAFCSKREVARIRQCTEHSGEVIGVGDGHTADFRLQLDSNTDFTAQIMLKYAKAIPQLKKEGYVGALDPFDLPLKYVADVGLI